VQTDIDKSGPGLDDSDALHVLQGPQLICSCFTTLEIPDNWFYNTRSAWRKENKSILRIFGNRDSLGELMKGRYG